MIKGQDYDLKCLRSSVQNTKLMLSPLRVIPSLSKQKLSAFFNSQTAIFDPSLEYFSHCDLQYKQKYTFPGRQDIAFVFCSSARIDF